MKFRYKEKYPLLFFLGIVFLAACSKGTGGGGNNPPPKPPETNIGTDVAFWLTRADKLVLFKKQTNNLLFNTTPNSYPTIEVDSTQQYQQIDGFGAALTQGSAYLINRIPEPQKTELLKELFTTDSTFIGISYLRISIGASDLSTHVYFYDDVQPGQSDPQLTQFSLGEDMTDLVPVLKKIVALNPSIKILASPWSAPVWMKTNSNSVGGSLKPENYPVYANYFVKYIKAMQEQGINIDAITVQNEPLNPYNNPSMTMQAGEQLDFIKNHLGPAFAANIIQSKIIINENNPDIPDYPVSILNDPIAKNYIDGSAFHLYGGDISGLTIVRNAHPDRNIYFTEQWVGAPGSFPDYLNSHVQFLIVGAVRNWSRNVIEWNLASDPDNNPHTPGGCNQCLGSITVNGATVTRNVGYYILAHATKFVRPGSVRIASGTNTTLPNVAFKTPDGKKVLIVLNTAQQAQIFNIKYKGKTVSPSLPPGSVGTFIW